MFPTRVLLIGMLLLPAIGCETTYAAHPVGERPVRLRASDWEGVWAGGEAVSIRVVDAEAGLLEAAWIEERDASFEVEVNQAHIMKYKEWMFYNVQNKDTDTYQWGRLTRNDDQLVLWFPETSRIRALVESDSLPGTVDEDGNVTLGSLAATHLELITSADIPLMRWEEPFVLVRMKR